MRIAESRANLETPLRVDRYLSERFDYLSRSAWQSMIGEGLVKINGVVAKANRLVRNGDVVAFEGEFRDEPPVDDEWAVLYEDESTVAIAKSGDLPVHPAGRYFENTLLRLAEKSLGTLHPVNRLDRETSGIVLFAKSSDACARYQKNLALAEKEYTAVVRGNPQDKFECALPIGPAHEVTRGTNDVVRKKRAAYAGAPESALTRFETLRRAEGYALVRALPETGRLHQIRVHLEASGFPIVGDKLYGGDERLFIEFIEGGMTDDLLQRLGFSRCALHAQNLRIRHAYKNELLNIHAPIPSDMAELIDRLFEQPGTLSS